MASMNDQLNLTGAKSQFKMMEESLASRNDHLAQTQSLSRSPQKMDAGERNAGSGAGLQDAEGNRAKMDKVSSQGILMNKDDKLRTISNAKLSKEAQDEHDFKKSSATPTEKPTAPARILED